MSRPSAIQRFRRCEAGTIAILWGMALVMFLGVGAMVYDVGRMTSTHGELQDFADAVALAAAGELDGKPDSITRAQTAATNLIIGHQTFAGGSQALAGPSNYALVFLSALSPNDANPSADVVTTNAASAIFAKVTITPRSVPLQLLTAVTRLLGTGSEAAISASLSATAVAGFTQEACDITPMMFCLPPADVDAGDDEGYYEADNHIGALIRMRTGGNGAAWGPGDFGFLDLSKTDNASICASFGSPAAQLRCMMGGEATLTQCYQTRGVNTEPGQKQGITSAAFNTRFDIYEGSMGSASNDTLYRPAPNVIKGRKIGVNGGGKCNKDDPSTTSMALPLDTCFTAGTCDRYGDSLWDRAGYLTLNHGDSTGSRLYTGGITTDPKYDGTRFEIYLREIQKGNEVGVNSPILTGADETGRKMCSSVPASPNPWRRVITVAGVDCVANPINGSAVGVPVEEYFEMFLTRPVGLVEAEHGSVGEKFDIWGEVIGSLGKSGYSSAGNGGIFRDVVQLYR